MIAGCVEWRDLVIAAMRANRLQRSPKPAPPVAVNCYCCPQSQGPYAGGAIQVGHSEVLGIILDGMPESVVIGLGIMENSAVSVAMLVTILSPICRKPLLERLIALIYMPVSFWWCSPAK